MCLHPKGRLGNDVAKGVLERVDADPAIIVLADQKTRAFFLC